MYSSAKSADGIPYLLAGPKLVTVFSIRIIVIPRARTFMSGLHYTRRLLRVRTGAQREFFPRPLSSRPAPTPASPATPVPPTTVYALTQPPPASEKESFWTKYGKVLTRVSLLIIGGTILGQGAKNTRAQQEGTLEVTDLKDQYSQ